jgi:calcineurin-like phosphoesterase family protein
VAILFTADFHFGHGNMIDYCDRPFLSVQAMDYQLIELYNRVVKPKDTVYILGDFSMFGTQSRYDYVSSIVRKLEGDKHLILGNHDAFRPFVYVNMGFLSVHTFLHLELLDLYLVHDPAVANVKRDKIWLHGHMHKLWKKQGNLINVGVDAWNYMPVTLDEIQALLLEEE